MLQQNHDDIDNIWIIIKQVRKNYLSYNDDSECQEYDNQIADDDIKTNIDNVEDNLTKKSMDYDPYDENVTEDILHAGVEMFTYLNFCPPTKLLQFYKELQLQRSTKDIILAMTNIIKTRRNSEKSTANKIWSETAKKLKHLKYKKYDPVTWRQINHITDPSNCTDQSCSEEIRLLGSMDVQKLSNHPVHLVDKDGNLNPTALVPFCSVSDNYSAMGVKIDQIDVPICNIFRPKISKDQLCYTVDLNKIKQKIDIKDTITFSFFIDYNEDREFSSIYDVDKATSKNADRARDGILIETIEPLHIVFENEYNLNVVKEISATDSFLSMDRDVSKCQDDETWDECVTRKYINDLKDKCKCLPTSLNLMDEVAVCGPNKMKCVTEENFQILGKNCLPRCSGLQISNYVQESIEKNIDLFQSLDTAFKMQLEILAETYKYLLPASLTSWKFSKKSKLQDLVEDLSEKYWKYKGFFDLETKDFEMKRNRLRFVKIKFDTSTFDKVTKDQAAKFVDILSAIGGTMGLLTGFSIISGVEILYFVFKTIIKRFQNDASKS